MIFQECSQMIHWRKPSLRSMNSSKVTTIDCLISAKLRRNASLTSRNSISMLHHNCLTFPSSVLQTDQSYVKLKDDMIFAEGAVQEVEAKLAHLNDDLVRIAEQLQQVFYMKSQLKSQSNPVEYLMPQIVTDGFARTNRAVRDMIV